VDLDTLVGTRCDVERSSDGVAADGGVGAGRYEVGATEVVKAVWDLCFLGGGGGDRWDWYQYMRKKSMKKSLTGFWKLSSILACRAAS
jgi:hypothetical protein